MCPGTGHISIDRNKYNIYCYPDAGTDNYSYSGTYNLLAAYNQMYHKQAEFNTAKEAMDRVDEFIIKYRKLKAFL